MIDAHAHLFPAVRGQVRAGPTRGLGHGRVTVGPRQVQLTPDLGPETCFLPGMLLERLDQAGVSQAVLLQGSLYGACNGFAAQAVRQHPGRFAAQAFLDLWELDWPDRLDRILASGSFRGIKIEFSEENGLWGLHPGARLDDPAFEPLWERLEREGRPLTLDLGAVGTPSYQTEAVAGLTAAYPGLPVVLCHLGQPRPAVFRDAGATAAWEAQVSLARAPKLYLDLASLPHFYREEGEPFPGVDAALRRAVDLVGGEKLVWGSDAPGTLTLCSYPRQVELARQQLAFLPADTQALVLRENARRIYFGAR